MHACGPRWGRRPPLSPRRSTLTDWGSYEADWPSPDHTRPCSTWHCMGNRLISFVHRGAPCLSTHLSRLVSSDLCSALQILDDWKSGAGFEFVAERARESRPVQRVIATSPGRQLSLAQTRGA